MSGLMRCMMISTTRLLREWANKVKERDGKCVICGRTEGVLQAHHIIPKGIPDYKFDVDNGITLCFQHHKGKQYSAHQNAVWFSVWLRDNRPDLYEYTQRKLDKLQYTKHSHLSAS